MARSPFVVDPQLSGIAIAYKNTDYIADIIAPRRTVSAELYEVDYLNIDDMYELHDDLVGRLSQPHQVTFSSDRLAFSTRDHGLDAPVPQKDMDNWQGVGPSPEAIATEGVTELVMLNREVRTARVVEDATNYRPENVRVLSGTSQWSDYANSNPISDMLAALDEPLVRPTTAGCSLYVWRILRQHPKVLAYVKGSLTDEMLSREVLRDALELQNFVVGTTRAKGLPRNITNAPTVPPRIWNKHFWMIGVDPLAQLLNMNRPTFLLTAQFGQKVSGRILDPDMGLKGGVRIRAGEMVRETVVSKECGYLFRNCVA
jgi:hypothetical protein